MQKPLMETLFGDDYHLFFNEPEKDEQGNSYFIVPNGEDDFDREPC